ncbi:putative swi/snf-related matrix-associated actin-dependent regulator [Fagus crenata]
MVVIHRSSFRNRQSGPVLLSRAISKTSRVSRTVVANSKRNGFENPNSHSSSEHEANATDCSVSDSVEDFVDVSRRESSLGSEWWFVGCSEVSGLSTCKGRRVKPGDEVVFTGEGFNC